MPRLVIAACLAAALSACSTVEGWFEGDPPPAQGAPAKPGAAGVPGAGSAIPNLSSVPGQAPRPVVTAEERKKLVQELTADSKGVQYAEPVVKPEQPAIAPPRPAAPRTPPAPAKAAEAPKPAEPAKPVASVQMPAAPKPAEPKPAEPATTVIQPPPPSTATVAPQPQPPVAAPPSPSQPPVVMQQALPPPPAAPPPAAPPPAAPPPAAMSQPIPTPPPPPLLAAVSPPPSAAPALGVPAPAPQAAPVPRGPRDPRAIETYNASRVAVSAQVGSIPFEANSARMRLDDVQLIRDIAAQQKKRGGTVRVVGFADAPVSAERAEQVARALLESGVKPERVYAGVLPATDPAFRTARPEAVPANRRVDIYIDY